jgi:orotidine-5'-phosphate decarboxylase
MNPKIIIALDFHEQQEALRLVAQLDPKSCALKVGNELFTLYGPDFVQELIKRKFKVFLDLKFHDIPNTVSRACKAAADLGVWMVNVHAAGGVAMMQAASNALNAYGANKPILIAVTVLTSFTEKDLSKIGISRPLTAQAIELALLAKEAGINGVVSSAHEVPDIKRVCGESFITVTPGIRLTSDPADDQSRIMTPKQAISSGSDYLVIGRSITQASDPLIRIHQILKDIS